MDRPNRPIPMRDFRPPDVKINPRLIALIIVAVFVVAVVWSSFFTVSEKERAVKLRLRPRGPVSGRSW